MDENTFVLNRERAVDYLNMLDRIYVVDAFAGWDAGSRLKIRVVCARPYHALFMHNMLCVNCCCQLQLSHNNLPIFKHLHFYDNFVIAGAEA